jgi:exodeoxyribonuclease VII large subunit
MSIPRSYQFTTEPNASPVDNVYSVAEYIALLNIKLKPLKATIQGEIGKIKYSQKAVYFSLIDKDRSVINCLVWLSRLNSLGIELKDGLEVKIQGYPDVYSQTGFLTFKADVIIPVGEGALKLAFDKLKKDLEGEGYFRQERKRQLPMHVESIGLITSENGVVIRDFLTGLGNHGLKVRFYDARVEGLNSVEEIVTAIQWFNENTQNVQVLIIARGGGSLERLQPFNTREIAKAIYSSRIPVMTAIGHELDVTIADLVADVRASVPMDAGQRIADQWIKAGDKIEAIEGTIISCFKNTSRGYELKLSNYQDNFVSCYAKNFFQYKKLIDTYQIDLMSCFRDLIRKIKSIEDNFNHNYDRFSIKLTHSKNVINGKERTLLNESNRFITKINTRMTLIEEQFINSYTRYRRYLSSLQGDIFIAENQIEREAKRWYLKIGRKIAECERMLLACDPQLKLKQGFSIVTDKGGHIIKSTQTVEISDIITVRLFEGEIKTKIEKIKLQYDRRS